MSKTRYLIKDKQGLFFIKQEGKNCFSFSSVGLEQLKNYTFNIKEAQDIVADYYNYLTLYDSCEENREESILDIIKYDEFVQGWL